MECFRKKKLIWNFTSCVNSQLIYFLDGKKECWFLRSELWYNMQWNTINLVRMSYIRNTCAPDTVKSPISFMTNWRVVIQSKMQKRFSSFNASCVFANNIVIYFITERILYLNRAGRYHDFHEKLVSLRWKIFVLKKHFI